MTDTSIVAEPAEQLDLERLRYAVEALRRATPRCDCGWTADHRGPCHERPPRRHNVRNVTVRATPTPKTDSLPTAAMCGEARS